VLRRSCGGLPASITENSTSITFAYGADRQRFGQVNGFTGTMTICVEGLFDREVTGATVNDVHYIMANGQAVATFASRNYAALVRSSADDRQRWRRAPRCQSAPCRCNPYHDARARA
jgi:hypothetical protein